MQEITVSRVDFYNAKSCGEGPLSGLLEGCDRALDFGNTDFFGNLVARREGNWSGRVDRRPSAIGRTERSAALPGDVGAGFATGVSELHTCDRSLRMNEVNDSRKEVDVSVLPDPEIRRRDAPFRRDSSSFREYKPSASYGACSEVDQVPVIGKASFAGILAHG